MKRMDQIRYLVLFSFSFFEWNATQHANILNELNEKCDICRRAKSGNLKRIPIQIFQWEILCMNFNITSTMKEGKRNMYINFTGHLRLLNRYAPVINIHYVFWSENSFYIRSISGRISNRISVIFFNLIRTN